MKKILFFTIALWLIIFNFAVADSTCNFYRSLSLGSRGDDVKCLQAYLQKEGFFSYTGGLTGYFGPVTKSAVSKWQAKNGVSPSLGYFGPISRAKYKEIVVLNNNFPPITTIPISSTVSLPTVKDDEIVIAPGGVSTTEDYLTKFFDDISTSTFPFDTKRFNYALKDENGILLFIPNLAEKAINDGVVSQDVKNSLEIQRDFICAQLDYLKNMRVYGDEAISLHKKLIGFHRLTIQLSQKILDFGNGKISKAELSDFFEQYKKLGDSERKNLLKSSGVAAREPNLIKRIISFLGIEDQIYVLAANLIPFGGQIDYPIPCLCDPGDSLLSVGPPSSVTLYVSAGFLSSPLFYDYKSLRPGAWWLGLHESISRPCLNPVGVPPSCYPTGFGSPVYMAGTSE